MEYVQYEQGYTVQVRHTNEDFLVQSEVHHQYEQDMECRQGTSSNVGKGSGTNIVPYTGSIFPAFDELYLLIIPVFNTTGHVMYFPS